MMQILRSFFHLRVPYKISLYGFACYFAGVSVGNIFVERFPQVVAYILYGVTAITFFLSCYYVVVDLKKYPVQLIEKVVKKNIHIARVVENYNHRTITFSIIGFCLNMVFAIFNGVIGLVNMSLWFACMSLYYILLSMMRFQAFRQGFSSNQNSSFTLQRINEVKSYRNLGIFFCITTIALGFMVYLLTLSLGEKNHPGLTIFAVACYTFYKIIRAIIHVVKASKVASPIVMSLRDIGYVDACVSILSLQSAMFASFGTEQIELACMMNMVTGIVVCLMTMLMGIRCIISANNMFDDLKE